ASFARTGEQNAEDPGDRVTQHEVRTSPEDDATVYGRFTEELLNLDPELTLVPVHRIDRQAVRWRDPRQVRQGPADAAPRRFRIGALDFLGQTGAFGNSLADDPIHVHHPEAFGDLRSDDASASAMSRRDRHDRRRHRGFGWRSGRV